MSGIVLDASALIAFMRDEPGGDSVANVLSDAVISSVNLSEVGAHFADHGYDSAEAIADIRSLPLVIEPFDTSDAEAASALRSRTRMAGLSLGDRACLALAQRLAAPAWTTDRAWKRLQIDVEIKLMR